MIMQHVYPLPLIPFKVTKSTGTQSAINLFQSQKFRFSTLKPNITNRDFISN